MHQPWPMPFRKGPDIGQPDSGSCCLRPAGITQSPLADYIFSFLNHSFIYSFIYWSFARCQAVLINICVHTIKTKNQCFNHKFGRATKNVPFYKSLMLKSEPWKGRNGNIGPGTGVFMSKCLWYLNLHIFQIQASRERSFLMLQNNCPLQTIDLRLMLGRVLSLSSSGSASLTSHCLHTSNQDKVSP